MPAPPIGAIRSTEMRGATHYSRAMSGEPSYRNPVKAWTDPEIWAARRRAIADS